MSDMTPSDIVIVVALAVGLFIAVVIAAGGLEQRDLYHGKLCAEWLADATTREDTLTIYLADEVCYRNAQ
ncbi:hypothetical protein LCGC14_2415900 [marine sediment metagenome]|uniref:Uncharacterized protein n=1 Tax=marine sediment metagenome TaxID=412755 RepID=A0A0F9E3A5_9ZZZZ